MWVNIPLIFEVFTKMKIKFCWLGYDNMYFGRVLLKFWRITLPQFLGQMGTEVTGSPNTFQPSNTLAGVISQESTKSNFCKL